MPIYYGFIIQRIFTYENFFKNNTAKTYFVSVTNLAFSFIKKKNDTSIPNEKKTYATLIKSPNSMKGKAATFTYSFVVGTIFHFLEHYAM